MSVREKQFAELAAGAGALLVVDVQRSFGDPSMLADYGLSEESGESVAAAVARCGVLVDAARSAGVPVHWIELATESPWRASQWLRTGDSSAPLDAGEPCVVGTPGAEWYVLEPRSDEARWRKTGYSGFLGTGLAERLREDGVEWVSVVGLTTECCILATATDAAQLDFPVYVARDATAAYEPHLHENALELLALNVGVVGDADELVELWASASVALSTSAVAS